MKRHLDFAGSFSFAILKYFFWNMPGYLSPIDEIFLLNSLNRGFLIDGRKKRIAEKHSFQSVMGLGGVGAGKSTTFVMPNLLTLDNCSFVTLDTSGEIFAQTSGDLKRRGFDIKVLNLMDLGKGEQYNPLAGATDFTSVAQMADIIIRSSLPDTGGDAFWNAGASKIVRIFIQCLNNRDEPEKCNLANVKYLINNFDAHLHDKPGLSKIDAWVAESCKDDEATWNDYKGFTNGNDRTMLSILSTADTGLSALGNPHIARLTATNTFDFAAMRQKKTAVFVLVRQQDMKFYSFLLNLFFTELFSSLLHDLDDKNLPVYLMLDEFGHLQIPSFDVFATTARKYKVGFWIFLQSLSQLEARYGRFGAETILDGLQTEIYLPGVSLDTAASLSRRMGKIDHISGSFVRQLSIMNETDIIQLEQDRALMFYSNKKPVIVKTKPFYKQRKMKHATRLTPCDMPQFPLGEVRYVDLPEPV